MNGDSNTATIDPATTPVVSQQPDYAPLKPKDPGNESQVKLVDTYNQFRQNGGSVSDLSYQQSHDLLAAVQDGNPQITDSEALSNPDTYFQQVYKPGKNPELLTQSVQHGAFWANLLPNVIGGGLKLVGDLATGTKDLFVDELQKANPFLSSHDREVLDAKMLNVIGSGVENARVMPLKLINGVSDLVSQASLHQQLQDPNLTGEQRDKLEHQESEIFRQQAIRTKTYEGIVDGASKDIAGIYRAIGATDYAKTIVSKEAQPSEAEKTVAQTVFDPTNIVTAGVGKLVSARGGLFIKSGIRTLAFEDAAKALTEAETTATSLAARRAALEARIEGAKSVGALDTRELETTLARQVPDERNAANAVVHARGVASELGNAVKSQMDQIIPGGVVRKAVGNTFGVLGDAVDQIAGDVEKLKGVPDSAAARIVGPGADSTIKEAVGSQLNNWGVNALKGVVSRATGVAGAAVGATVGGLPGALIGHGVGETIQAGLKILFNPNAMRSVARDFKVIGKQLALGRQTLPFFKSVSEKTTGMTSAIASKLDNQLVYSIPDVLRGGVAGSAVGAGMGFVSGSGQTDPTVQGAAGGFMFGMGGGGLGQIGKFNSPGTLHAARIGDRSRFMGTLSPQDRPMFNRLRPDEQLAVSVYAMAHPDLHIKFFDQPKGPNGEHYVDDRGPVVTLNVNGDNPLQKIFEHELGHHVASNDLAHVVTDYMVGNVMKSEPGIFTQYGDDGKPIINIDPVTKKSAYMPDERFSRYTSEYNQRKARDLPDQPPEDTHGIAQEMFAELHASAFKDPILTQKMVRGFVPSDLISENVLANWFGKIGMAYDPITGTPLSGPEIAKVRGLVDLVTRYHKGRSWKDRPIEREGGQTFVTQETWRADPNVIYKNLDGAGILTVDPKTGEYIKGTDGLPVIKSSKEADADLAKMTKSVVNYVQANPRIEGHVGDNVLKSVTDRDGRQFLRGQQVPQEVLDHVAAENAHNPWQIQNWRKLNDIMTRNDGSMVLINYNTPQKGGKYASLAMKERAVVPIHTEVSLDTGQVNIKAYDPEQMAKHVAKMVRRPKGQELWGGKVNPALQDVNTYLSNLAASRPGEADIGLSKKALINEIFGFPNTANPSITDIAKRPTNQSVLKSFRLDRINRIRETSGVTVPFHEATYEQVRSYAQPRRLGSEGVPAEPPAAVQAIPSRPEPFAHLPDESLPKLSDVAHTKHLPPGAHFLDPKGVRRKVPHG